MYYSVLCFVSIAFYTSHVRVLYVRLVFTACFRAQHPNTTF